jgi:hypothetical protein
MSYDLVALWEAHYRYEFETRDVDATMATMVAAPCLWCVQGAFALWSSTACERPYGEPCNPTLAYKDGSEVHFNDLSTGLRSTDLW